MKRCLRLQALSREHHSALVLAKRLVLSEENTGFVWRHALPEIFAQELEPHFHSEESDLLSRLSAAGAQALVERTVDEHTRLRALVLAIGQGDRAAIADFAALLQAHVRFEERELFPAAERLLTPTWLSSQAA